MTISSLLSPKKLLNKDKTSNSFATKKQGQFFTTDIKNNKELPQPPLQQNELQPHQQVNNNSSHNVSSSNIASSNSNSNYTSLAPPPVDQPVNLQPQSQPQQNFNQQLDSAFSPNISPQPLPLNRARSPLAQPPTTSFDDSNYGFKQQSSIQQNQFKNSPLYFLSQSDNSSSSADSTTNNNSSNIGNHNNFNNFNNSKNFNLPKLNSSVSEVSSVNDQYSLQSPKLRQQARQSDVFSDNGSFTTNNTPKRTLSDRAKKTPSSFVRQSRLFSNDLSDIDSQSLNSLNGKSLLLQNKIQTENLSPEFHPIVTLLNAQKLRTYCIGSFQILGFWNLEKVFFEVDSKLTGNELAIWRPSNDEYIIDNGHDEFKPKYINLIDSNFEILGDLQIKIYQDYRDDSNIIIRFHNNNDFYKWVSGIILSKFEYIKLNEAFTAVLLSSKGSKLSDIHVLLSHKKRFIEYEWCNIRLPEISSKWLKIYMVILPSDKHHLGRIEIYPSDKKMQKKHLIAYISDLSSLFNVYPEQSNMIDFNSIMSASGNIHINRNYEYLFPYSNPEQNSTDPRKLIAKNHHSSSVSRSGSNNSLSSLANNLQPPSTPMSRSRSGSLNSTNSFFNHSPSNTNLNNLTRNRSISNVSDSENKKFYKKSQTEFDLNKTNSNFFKKHAEEFVSTNIMYIMPIPHPGVSAVETMVRNFIPIIDSFKLYGRPKHLLSDKTNPNSMLFGLPSLPHYQYLSTNDSFDSFKSYFNDHQNHQNLSIFEMENILKSKIINLQQRNNKPFKGHGDINKLYDNLDLSFDEIHSPVLNGIDVDGNNNGISNITNNNNNNSPNNLPSLGDPINLNSPRIASPLSV
ncbi:uncharacterized protein KGF55_001887 [Candida pseudojiufengensis]|uniref:uncharacterized protein n=1 Tax=Candida pseudojiufengensis TaxID=497109 RepID=UPI0022247389|nr:uncharacterized protein KGF55_001887 [Candida pseudojiufengensis]KAI5964817.1 hypothetical protein KGF55_001887 [Candida pseudojiufengensis]